MAKKPLKQKSTKRTPNRSFEAASHAPRLKNFAQRVERTPKPLDLMTLRQRARFLCQNNPLARRAVQVLVSHMIGRGITPHTKNAKIEKHLKRWADTTACDFDRRQNLYGLESLVARHVIRDGEVLVRKIISPRDSIPLRLQLIEIDQLDEGLTCESPRIRSGIEYDLQGQRKAYWLRRSMDDITTTSVRIPASEILHIFNPERAGQERGFSWLAPIIVRLKDFDDYEDAQIMRQKIATSFVGVFYDMEFLDSPDEAQPLAHIEPGSFISAPAGKKIEFSSPPSVQGFGEFAENTKLTLASGVDIPYMLLSSDYSKSNYSSSRLAMLNFFRVIEPLQLNFFIPQFCEPIFEWFTEALSYKGIPVRAPPLWATPKRDFIDPAKEMEAYKTAVESGFMTHADVLRELGKDPQDTYQEMKTLQETWKTLGLTSILSQGTPK